MLSGGERTGEMAADHLEHLSVGLGPQPERLRFQTGGLH